MKRRFKIGFSVFCASAAFVLFIMPMFASVAFAATATLFVSGVTAPGGEVFMGTHMWVADHFSGFCRVDSSAAGLALNLGTCITSATPGDAPNSPGQPVFDAATNFVYMPDNSAMSLGVWRMTFDPASETVTIGSQTVLAPAAAIGDTRPTAVALGPDGNLYVTAIRTGNIIRITTPSGPAQAVQAVGVSSDARSVGAITFIGPDLYLAEGAAVTKILNAPACLGACVGAPTAVSATAPTAIVSDGVDVLFVAETPVRDSTILQHTVSTGAEVVFATNGIDARGALVAFQNVNVLTFDPAGNLYIDDDPSAGAGFETARIWQIPGGGGLTLTVTKSGTGTGTVTSDPVGIICGAACSSAFPPSVVTLTAAPSAGSTFTVWTGCTPVVGNPNQCTATLAVNTTVDAAFTSVANFAISPASVSLGGIVVGSTVLQTITITNTGVVPSLTVGPITITPGDFTIASDLCSGIPLNAAASCTVMVKFLTATTGPNSATLNIPSNDPLAPIISVPLSGSGSLIPVFGDVPAGAFAGNFINSLFYNGITEGCGGGFFCPNFFITRKEMAVFLETSLGVVTAPACLGNIFTDVTVASVGAAFCGYIEKLATDGITGGCGGTNFCPNDPVTRGQMAVFIETALKNPAIPCTAKFTDVTATDPSCGLIERLASDGITGGCTATTFCPNDPVTRAQMAIFLVAAPPPLLP